MDLSPLLSSLTPLDAAAIALMALVWAAIGWVIEHPPAARPSVSVLMAEVRRAWMREYPTRETRIFDATIITNLRQSTSFFASTSLLAVGGVLALIGNISPLIGVAAGIGTAPVPALLWQVRLMPVVLLLTHAFLKFVWSHRVFGYCAVMMAAVPADAANPQAARRAVRAGELNIRAALHFNAGLRSMYFALGALGWLLGPWGLVGGTAIVTWLLVAREFWSHPRDILLGD